MVSWQSRVLQDLSGGCSGTGDYYRSTQEVVLIRTSTTGAVGRLNWYRRVLCEHWGGCAGTDLYYMSTLEVVLILQSTRGAVLVQQKPIGTLGSLRWYSRVLKQRSRGTTESLVVRAEYCRSSQEAVPVQHRSIIRALRRLCWYRAVIQEHLGGCVGTAEDWRFCWYSRVLQVQSGGCAGTEKYYSSTKESCVGTEDNYSNTREDLLVQQSTI